MLSRNKNQSKGQAGSGAATLVAVIGLLIVLYILFLPPDIRRDLLDDNKSTGGASSGEVVTTLLKENPGRLEEIDKLELEHNLPSVNLYSLSNAKVLKKASSIYVKNGIFDKKTETLSFGIADLEHTANVMLSFKVKDSKGRLIITLNSKEIYNNEITTSNILPIELPKDSLEESNILEFGVSEVGFAFWRTNEYSLENIQATADITDPSTQESRNTFVISTTEKFNADKAKLKFLPECNPGDVGVLEIFINNQQIFSSVPDCGSLRPIEFSAAYLENGENKVVFRTNKGRYLIDQISITTKLKEITFPSYFFEIDRDDFNDIRDNKLDVNLTMRFVDNQELKTGKIFINGKTISMNTREAEFSRNLDNFVEEDQNGLKVEPDKTVLDIIELRVDLVKH